jgi:F-type H+-transporting ATPase subunit b
MPLGLHNVILSLGSAAPHADEQQLLDLDGTIFLTVGLFLVFFLFLSQLLWKPYLKVKAERIRRVDGFRADAAKMEADSKVRFQKVEEGLAEARRLTAGELMSARAEARTRETTLMSEAQAKSQAALEEARKALATSMTAEKARLQGHAEKLGAQLATKVLGRSVS